MDGISRTRVRMSSSLNDARCISGRPLTSLQSFQQQRPRLLIRLSDFFEYRLNSPLTASGLDLFVVLTGTLICTDSETALMSLPGMGIVHAGIPVIRVSSHLRTRLFSVTRLKAPLVWERGVYSTSVAANKHGSAEVFAEFETVVIRHLQLESMYYALCDSLARFSDTFCRMTSRSRDGDHSSRCTSCLNTPSDSLLVFQG